MKADDYKDFQSIGKIPLSVVIDEGDILLDAIVALCCETRVCVQAGGNFGIFPHYLSKKFDSVISFEPCPEVYELCKKNIQGRDNIRLIGKGLSDFVGSCSMVRGPKENYGASHVNFSDEGGIPVTTIDSELAGEEACDLILLDVEGAEYRALKGAVNTIRKYRPVIVLENKGLIPDKEFKTGFLADGNIRFRSYIVSEFGYVFHSRIGRDDVLLPQER